MRWLGRTTTGNHQVFFSGWLAPADGLLAGALLDMPIITHSQRLEPKRVSHIAGAFVFRRTILNTFSNTFLTHTHTEIIRQDLNSFWATV